MRKSRGVKERQEGREREREAESTFIRADSIGVPSGFARDQAGVCCDSPWVTTISCFIHNAALPQLINVRLPINGSHKTPTRLWLMPPHGQKKKEKKNNPQTKKSSAVKLHLNPQELQISWRANKYTQGHGCTGSIF